MLIRFILLSVCFLGRGQLDKVSSWTVLWMSCSAYQWNMQKLAGIAHINANNNGFGIFPLFVGVKVSRPWSFYLSTSGGKKARRWPGGGAGARLSNASPGQYLLEGTVPSAFSNVPLCPPPSLPLGNSAPGLGLFPRLPPPQDSWLLQKYCSYTPYFIKNPFPKGLALN